MSIEATEGALANFRAGLAYKLVIFAARIYPPLYSELVEDTLSHLMKGQDHE